LDRARVAAAGVAGGCGSATSSTQLLGGESHFLDRCTTSCESGLDCISGICTRACVVGQESSCSPFSGAVCTSDSFALGAVAVCDVSCASSADCARLGADYGCWSGYCRGSSSASEVKAGAGLADAGSAEPAVDCAKYRDVPGTTEVAVTVRNARSSSLYLEPFRQCNSSSIVDWERNGARVGVRAFESCWRPCAEIQDTGDREPWSCVDGCLVNSVIRLEPGAELDAGRVWNEFVDYGIGSSTERMPDSCAPIADSSSGGLASGVACFAEVPLRAGPYRIIARAFDSTRCLSDEPCDCVPNASGTCTTNYAQGAGSAIEADATATLPVSAVTITFR
jgi:hypothetical protein